MLKASNKADAPAQSSGNSHRDIEVIIEKYLARREATNSARNAKPLFTNIEKEQRDLAIRQRQFKAEIQKAMEKLGDMSQFQKYLKRRKPVKAKEFVVEVQPYSITVMKASMTPNTQRAGKRRLFLTSTGATDDMCPPHRRTKTALPSARRPQTTKSSSSGYKSTPMHQDPQYKFRLKSAFSERVNVSSQLSLQLDNVVSKCGEAEQQFSETKREAASFDSKNAHIRHRSLEDISDMLESLHVEGSAENFEETMRRKRVGRHVDRSVLAEAGQAKSSFLASSEFVAKYAHKGIWRFDTLSLTRHADKLINSLPVTRGLVR